MGVATVMTKAVVELFLGDRLLVEVASHLLMAKVGVLIECDFCRHAPVNLCIGCSTARESNGGMTVLDGTSPAIPAVPCETLSASIVTYRFITNISSGSSQQTACNIATTS